MRDPMDVLVVAFGAPGLLDTCLAGLAGEYRMLVVDNSSDAAVRAIAVRHGATYLDPERNLGFGAGVNLGLAHLTDPKADVLLLNPDASIAPNGISELHACLHARSDLACVAPAQTDPTDGSAARVGWPLPTPAGAWVEAVGLGGLRRKVEFVIGSVLLLRAEALADVGGFDERFFLYAEETDWQRRAHDRGWKVALCPHVVATHLGAGTGGDAERRETHFHASHERYLRKHHGAAGWTVYRAGVMVGALARALLLPGARGRQAASRFRLYWSGPCRVESRLPEDGPPVDAGHQ